MFFNLIEIENWQRWAQITFYQKRSNFRNKLFYSVEAQRNSAIVKREVVLSQSTTSAIKCTKHDTNSAFLQF